MSTPTIPSPTDYYLNHPLYTPLPVNYSTYQDILRIEFFEGTLDAYCPHCHNNTIFSTVTINAPYLQHPRDKALRAKGLDAMLASQYEHADTGIVAYFPQLIEPHPSKNTSFKNFDDIHTYATQDRMFTRTFTCSRETSHTMIVISHIQGSRLAKIGQHPSLRDIHTPHIRKYQPLLGEKYDELATALTLGTHNIGIGAFIYLRRVFEHLIEEAHTEANTRSSWTEEREQEYQDGRVEERVKLLEDFLPPFLVTERKMYGILSKGVHELTEDECMSYFATLRQSIELILEMTLATKEAQNKEKQLKDALSSITRDLKRDS